MTGFPARHPGASGRWTRAAPLAILLAMSTAASSAGRRYTWADYRRWPGDERWELIAGVPLAMSPAPSIRHQIVSMRLGSALDRFLAGRPCRVFAAPTDLKLSDEDVVQPDLMVVCDPAQVRRSHVDGPPRLVVEIVSPDSHVRDRNLKMELYARSQVAECWIVTPFPPLVEVFSLHEGCYRFWKAFGMADTLRSGAFPELALPLANVFDFPIEPDEAEVLRVRELPAAYRA
jgi:Uma2 family endonuclease